MMPKLTRGVFKREKQANCSKKVENFKMLFDIIYEHSLRVKQGEILVNEMKNVYTVVLCLWCGTISFCPD